MHMAGQKVGFYSIRKYARLMCQFIFIFTPIIKKAYPDSEALHAALAVANAACEALVSEIDAVAPVGV
jgi:hypothetical protein